MNMRRREFINLGVAGANGYLGCRPNSATAGNSAWLNWENLGGPLTSSPQVVSWGPNRLDDFARGTQNELLHKWKDGSLWSRWQSLGGNLTSAPCAVSWGPNRLDVFVRGAYNSCYHVFWDGTAWRDGGSLGGD